MLKVILALLLGLGFALSGFVVDAGADPGQQMADERDVPKGGQPPTKRSAGGAPEASSTTGSGSPLETAKTAEKGTLESPFPDFASVAEEGHKKYMAAGCNGCHGGTGGGGMGPPLTNPIWVYGTDDDTLFRLIALGSDALQKQGYSRKGSESVVGPMPPMGKIVKSTDDMWKIIAFIRSVNPSSAGAASASVSRGGPSPQ